MRVSLVGPTHPYRGGIAHHTTLLCKTLRKKHEVQFISYKRQYPSFLFPGKTDKDPSADGLLIDNVDFLLDSVNPTSWLTTARSIARFKPELLILPWWVVFWAPVYICLIAFLRVFSSTKVVFLCHNVIEHDASLLKRIISRMTLSMADRIITQSSDESGKARDLLGANFPVVTGFHPTYAPLAGSEVSRSEIRQELNLDGNILLFFGFVRPYKGLDVLLDAMPEVIRKTGAKLLVIGEFWKDKDSYLEQIERLGIGDFVHIVDEYVPNEDIPKYFTASDVVVQPYRSATGSGVCQLAYGLGKPVIATEVGNMPDVISHGQNGMLVPPGDHKALAAAIVASLEKEKLDMLTINAGEMADRFSWEKLIEIIC